MAEEYNFKGPTETEAALYKKYFDKEMLFSLENFKKAKTVHLVKVSKKNIIKRDVILNIKSIEFCENPLKSRPGKFDLYLKINEDFYSFSSLLFCFDCQECGEERVIHGNPSRDLSYFRSFYCEKCFKNKHYRSKEYRDKYKKTMIEKYGTDATMKVPKIREKVQKTMIERYGVPYSAMNPDLLKKSAETTKIRYGERMMFGHSFAEKMFASEMEVFVSTFGLSSFSCLNECKQVRLGPRKICIIDFFVPEINLAIEFFGDYFHGNPEIYKEDHLFKIKGMSRTELNEKDKKRQLQLESVGIDTFVVWENDWNKNRDKVFEDIKSIIKERLRLKNERD